MSYAVLNNVLSTKDFEFLKSHLLHQDRRFQALDLGGTHMYAHKVPFGVSLLLDKAIKEATGLNLQSVASFVRLNKKDLDTSFRVHADSDIKNQKIVVAAVFYLEDSEISGTALFKHPIHGHKASSQLVFTEDDGLWDAYYKYYAKANTMLVYDASFFHGRFPWKVPHERKVIVKFMTLRNKCFT